MTPPERPEVAARTRLAGLRESLRAANGDWHDITALWSIQNDLDWLLADAERRAAVAEPLRGALDEVWAEVIAITPTGWLFHGVELEDNSMDGGDWGPGWVASMSWPAHCQFSDCDHDEAFRIGRGKTPVEALRSLVDDFDWTNLPERYRDSVWSQNA